jgi:replication factor A1
VSVGVGEYLACLSVKYEVEPDKLFGALVLAGERSVSKCGDLAITCRSKLQDKTVLLITNGSNVVAQFPVSKQFLSERSNPIEISRRTNILRMHLRQRQKNKEPHSFHVSDLRHGMKRVNLKAKVLEISRPTAVYTKYGNCAKVTNARVADETGTIKLCLWNEQITSISIKSTVQIENATVSTFRGERQLRIGKSGALHIIEDTILARRSA